MKYTTLLTAFAVLLISAMPARAALELNEGDSVIVVGNTFAERIALSGYLDAMIHAANPGKKIVVRSVPNSADEVGDMPREHSVPPADFYLKRHGADVVVMCFGMSESFNGLGGVERFEKDLAGQVDKHLKANYNGASSPKIVLVSPIAHEDLGAPLPTGDAVVQRNSVLRAYTAAMQKVAEAKGAVFIDLFTPSAGLYDQADAPLTNNGIAPNELGCYYFVGEMAKQVGWWDGNAAGESDKAAGFRQVAYDKHYHWRHRYRATNTEYVWGRRHKPFGIVNFPPELEQLDKMVATREAAMWEMDAPSVGELFAKAPTGKAIWEDTPTTYDFPGDKWDGVEIPQQDAQRAVGDTNEIAPPEDYIKTFKVADGYQVNLFASEREFPELQNPLAMTFDYQGRLWVLCSPTYPHPHPGDVTDCKLIILEDTDGDGKADKSTIFARHMNIPTGFVIDANGVAYVGQAPDLWKLTDTTGDDVADRKEIVYSGFGMADSHHTISAFVWDPNGGILMLEGVFTRTNVETPYGTQRTRDAAIWRFDPRTQQLIAIGHTSHPNPWGQTFDEYGQSILMDTSGANQYNFSSLISPYIFPEKPPKGPPVVRRGRPTSGAEIIYSSHFPDDVQGTYVHSQCIGFLGTNWDRLNADGAKNSGYTSEPMPQPLLASDIGNYRPVCSELGADGAMYIADWVNPLIGHMQFNLRDPRRDHTHGRIYRVTHKERPLVEKIDLTQLDMAGLFEQFKSTEKNTRDRARRLLQNMDAQSVSKAASEWIMDQNPRDPAYDRLALEALWVQQGVGQIDLKVVDEVMRGREPLARAGAMRVLRLALQFGEMNTNDAKPFILQSVSDRDMRVRLEAVMACAFMDSADAADIANRVTNQEMDGPIRNAHQQTIKVLQAKGITSVAGLPAIYAAPKDELLAELKKKEIDPLVARAVIARDDLPLDSRRRALQSAADTPELRALVLMQTAKNSVFDPGRTAEAIAPLLLELPAQAVFAISSDLDALMDSDSAGLRSAAVALKVRSGASLTGLAARDPVALLEAVASLSREQVPETLPIALIDLAQAGQLDPGTAMIQASRLSSDKPALFNRLASLAEPAMQLSFDQWGQAHILAMAALAGMHQSADEDWPAGFDMYRMARAEPSIMELGKKKYLHPEKGCAKCHGERGEGTPGFPPLTHSPMVVGDPVRAAAIVRYGLTGDLPHSINPADGKPYNAQMEPVSYYNFTEMAATLTYVRQHFGNFAEPVTLKHMQASPEPDAEKGEGKDMWKADALLSRFPFERDHLGPLPPPAIDIVKISLPAAGLWLMLGGVGVSMLFILVVTYAGKFMNNPHSLANLASDQMHPSPH